jgi:hypothetical protein
VRNSWPAAPRRGANKQQHEPRAPVQELDWLRDSQELAGWQNWQQKQKTGLVRFSLGLTHPCGFHVPSATCNMEDDSGPWLFVRGGDDGRGFI